MPARYQYSGMPSNSCVCMGSSEPRSVYSAVPSRRTCSIILQVIGSPYHLCVLTSCAQNNEDGGESEKRPLAHVISDGALAVVAGSDTTANILTHVFFFLLSNPAEYMRLQAEVDKFYPPGEDVLDTKSHQSMPVLNAAMYATCRTTNLRANYHLYHQQ